MKPPKSSCERFVAAVEADGPLTATVLAEHESPTQKQRRLAREYRARCMKGDRRG